MANFFEKLLLVYSCFNSGNILELSFERYFRALPKMTGPHIDTNVNCFILFVFTIFYYSVVLSGLYDGPNGSLFHFSDNSEF